MKRERRRPTTSAEKHRLSGSAAVGFAVFGPPPLLPGEKLEDYQSLLAQISSAVESVDVIDRMWVRDITDLHWDVVRLQRLKVNLIASSAQGALVSVLVPLLDAVEAEDGEE